MTTAKRVTEKVQRLQRDLVALRALEKAVRAFLGELKTARAAAQQTLRGHA